EIRVGAEIDDDRLEFSAEQAAFVILSCNQHENRIFEHRFADCHVSRQGMQNSDLDGILVLRRRRHGAHQQQKEQSSRERRSYHGKAPTSSKTRVSFVMPLAVTDSKALN